MPTTVGSLVIFVVCITGGKRRGGSYVPLKFKVGTGQVIRGWDEALMTMGLEEKAELTILPEWAYGRKGLPDNKYPFDDPLFSNY